MITTDEGAWFKPVPDLEVEFGPGSKRTRSLRVHEYRLPTPVTAQDLMRTLDWAEKDWHSCHRDAKWSATARGFIKVAAEDGYLTLSFEEETHA